MKTSTGKKMIAGALCAVLTGLTTMSMASAAPRAGCVEVKSVAQTEQETRDQNGQTVVRLVDAAAIVPGTQVIWTITASNICAQPAANVLIDNPVPEHMSFVADSAVGAGAAISYSLDGKRYAASDALQVRDGKDALRTARADEYAFIRWAFHNPIAPGQVAIARFRAIVK